jgi:DNA transformation protein
MAKENEFVKYVLELLEPMEKVTARAMFGGYGIFKDGMMFGLIADDILYFKTDDFNRFEFERLNLKPFTYNKNGKEMVMSYNQAPEEVFDNSRDMIRWARLGFDAAIRRKRN